VEKEVISKSERMIEDVGDKKQKDEKIKEENKMHAFITSKVIINFRH